MDVLACRERRTVDRGAVHGAEFDRVDSRAAVLADCAKSGHRSLSSGRHHDGEHGNWHDSPASGFEFIRSESFGKNGTHGSLDRLFALGRRDAALFDIGHLRSANLVVPAPSSGDAVAPVKGRRRGRTETNLC